MMTGMMTGSATMYPYMLTDATLANLKRLHSSLDYRGKDRFTLIGVCKHVRDLIQEAEEKRGKMEAGQNQQLPVLETEWGPLAMLILELI